MALPLTTRAPLSPWASSGNMTRYSDKAYDVAAAEQMARGQVGAAQAQAAGNAAAGRYAGTGTAEAGRYGGLAGLAGAMANDNANRYGAYAAAEGNRQTAMANEASARASASAMAEASRQTALGNLGTAALGAYGNASNQALSAWAANQQAYNQALAQMQGANQGAMASYGIGRNAALTGLSSGGDFLASGPMGEVASGSYGGAQDASRNIMNPAVLDGLRSGAERDLRALTEQHASSRGMPLDMQRQTFADLLTMGDQYVNPTMAGMDQFYASQRAPDFASGMNQFYGNMNAFRPDYSGVLEALSRPTSMGGSATLGSLFGRQAVGMGQMTLEGQERDRIAAENLRNEEYRRRFAAQGRA